MKLKSDDVYVPTPETGVNDEIETPEDDLDDEVTTSKDNNLSGKDIEYTREKGSYGGFGYDLMKQSTADDGEGKKPLVIFLPGDDPTGTSDAVFGAIDNGTNNFDGYALCLSRWDISSGNLVSIIDKLSKEYDIDTENMVLVGFSAGAANAMTITAENDGLFKRTWIVSAGAGSVINMKDNVTETEVVGVVGTPGGDGAYGYMTGTFKNYYDVIELDANHSIGASGIVQKLLKLDEDGDGISDFLFANFGKQYNYGKNPNKNKNEEESNGTSLVDDFMAAVIAIDKLTAEEGWTYGTSPENVDVEGVLSTNKKQMQCGTIVSVPLITIGFLTYADMSNDDGQVQYNSPERLHTALTNKASQNIGEIIKDPKGLEPGDIIFFYNEKNCSWQSHVEVFAGYDDNGNILVYSSGSTEGLQTEGSMKSFMSYTSNRWEAYRLPKNEGYYDSEDTTDTGENYTPPKETGSTLYDCEFANGYDANNYPETTLWDSDGHFYYENNGKLIKETFCHVSLENAMDRYLYTITLGQDEGYWIRDDGVQMIGEYVMYAANIEGLGGQYKETAQYNRTDDWCGSSGPGKLVGFCKASHWVAEGSSKSQYTENGQTADEWFDTYTVWAKDNDAGNIAFDETWKKRRDSNEEEYSTKNVMNNPSADTSERNYITQKEWESFFNEHPGYLPEGITRDQIKEIDWEEYYKDPKRDD